MVQIQVYARHFLINFIHLKQILILSSKCQALGQSWSRFTFHNSKAYKSIELTQEKTLYKFTVK